MPVSMLDIASIKWYRETKIVHKHMQNNSNGVIMAGENVGKGGRTSEVVDISGNLQIHCSRDVINFFVFKQPCLLLRHI